ncbi:hypothetical protein B0H19DRAFT_525706 [Mycena capillaripes]|nr:hypothetical protein B0H19DRAFT_525706 [Mycena capillaripes]
MRAQAGVRAGALVAPYLPSRTDGRWCYIARCGRARTEREGRCAGARRTAHERRLHPFFFHNLRFLPSLRSSLSLPESLPSLVIYRLLSWPHFSCADDLHSRHWTTATPQLICATLPLPRSSDLPPPYRSSPSSTSCLDTGTRRAILHAIRTSTSRVAVHGRGLRPAGWDVRKRVGGCVGAATEAASTGRSATVECRARG